LETIPAWMGVGVVMPLPAGVIVGLIRAVVGVGVDVIVVNVISGAFAAVLLNAVGKANCESAG